MTSPSSSRSSSNRGGGGGVRGGRGGYNSQGQGHGHSHGGQGHHHGHVGGRGRGGKGGGGRGGGGRGRGTSSSPSKVTAPTSPAATPITPPTSPRHHRGGGGGGGGGVAAGCVAAVRQQPSRTTAAAAAVGIVSSPTSPTSPTIRGWAVAAASSAASSALAPHPPPLTTSPASPTPTQSTSPRTHHVTEQISLSPSSPTSPRSRTVAATLSPRSPLTSSPKSSTSGSPSIRRKRGGGKSSSAISSSCASSASAAGEFPPMPRMVPPGTGKGGGGGGGAGGCVVSSKSQSQQQQQQRRRGQKQQKQQQQQQQHQQQQHQKRQNRNMKTTITTTSTTSTATTARISNTSPQTRKHNKGGGKNNNNNNNNNNNKNKKNGKVVSSTETNGGNSGRRPPGGHGIYNNGVNSLNLPKTRIRVLPCEKEEGPVEYKRQIIDPTPTRLRTLATQMSYRLDEGCGTATYHIGVEDDGSHSLLDYNSVCLSARYIEGLGRSLNAIVIRKRYVQGEVDKDGQSLLTNNKSFQEEVEEEEDKKENEEGEEGFGRGNRYRRIVDWDEEEEEVDHHGLLHEDDDDNHREEQQQQKIDETTKGLPTRCRLTLQRVETHLLDPSPDSLAEISAAAAAVDSVVPSESTTTASSITTATSQEENDTTKNAEEKNAEGEGKSSISTTRTTRTKTSLLSPQPQQTTVTTTTTTTTNASSKSPIPPQVGTTATVATPHDHKLHPSSSSSSPPPPANSVSETLSTRNIRIAVVGNVDAGKSTLIGTLTTSSLDDGRGKTRTYIMKHRHEIESGRTSTATSHLLGFKSTGQAVSGSDKIRAHRLKSEDEIARESHRIVTLMDLAGHEKYLKTTIHGVSSGFADYALILVNGRHPPTHMTQHHVNLCCSFGIPLIVVFTKIDGCPEHALKTSRSEVVRMLRGSDVGKRPYAIRTEDDVQMCADKMHAVAPLFDTSCVTGEGLDLLKKMLFCLPKRRRHEKKLNRPFEFLVEDIFNVPGVGAVVSGFVNAGELNVGVSSRVYVGPTDDGTFLTTVAKSAHIARINTSHVSAGQSACLAFSLNKEMRKKLRRGMVVLKDSPTSTKHFDAEICVLKGEGTTIRRSYQAYVHILNVRQSAYARHIELMKTTSALCSTAAAAAAAVGSGAHLVHRDEDDGIVLRPGSRAKVRFEFAKRPEYIRPGMRMLFRDGRVRGVGIITAIPEVQAVN